MLGLKDGQSLTVDLHRGQLAHQTLELKFRNALAGCSWTLRSLFPRRKTARIVCLLLVAQHFSPTLGFLSTTVFVRTI